MYSFLLTQSKIVLSYCWHQLIAPHVTSPNIKKKNKLTNDVISLPLQKCVWWSFCYEALLCRKACNPERKKSPEAPAENTTCSTPHWRAREGWFACELFMVVTLPLLHCGCFCINFGVFVCLFVLFCFVCFNFLLFSLPSASFIFIYLVRISEAEWNCIFNWQNSTSDA